MKTSTVYKIYKAIARPWKAIRRCFKGCCPGSPPDPGPPTKRLLSFAINNYPGTTNDLQGCIRDQECLVAKLKKDFIGFDVDLHTDKNVTKVTFLSELKAEVTRLRPLDVLLVQFSGHGTYVADPGGDEPDGYDEAICVHDGIVIDDSIGRVLESVPEGATVVLMIDSCFSGTITRTNLVPNAETRNRFMDPGYPRIGKNISKYRANEMNHVVLSGCGESQTSADTYINGKYRGAFTFFALLTLEPGITYKEWMTRIHDYLPSSTYSQVPTLEGKESLLNKVVFT